MDNIEDPLTKGLSKELVRESSKVDDETNLILEIELRIEWLRLVVGEEVVTPKSLKRHFNHETSQIASARTLYSALVELLETIVCFFDFYEIRQDPKKIQYPVTDLLEKLQLAQSLSQKTLRFKEIMWDLPGVVLVEVLDGGGGLMLGDCVGLVFVLLIGSVRGTCEVVFGRTVVEVEYVGCSGRVVAGVMEDVGEIEGVGDVGDGDGGLN
ncbi:hypothetical protein Tco_0126570 [Tanacetum coccineum]